MDWSSDEVEILHDTFQIEIKWCLSLFSIVMSKLQVRALKLTKMYDFFHVPPCIICTPCIIWFRHGTSGIFGLWAFRKYYFCTSLLTHPIRVVEQGNYHVIVYHVYSGVQYPMISMLFIPYRISEYSLSWNLPCDTV